MKTKVHNQTCKIVSSRDKERPGSHLALFNSIFFNMTITPEKISSHLSWEKRQELYLFDQKYRDWFLGLDPETGELVNWFEKNEVYEDYLILHNNFYMEDYKWAEMKGR